MPVITDEFRTANYVEAGLWLAIGLIAAVVAMRKTGRVRSRCLLLAAAMLAFGCSDLVETTTGAWWTPWWLFAWKAACVVVFLLLLGERYRLQFRRSGPPAQTPDPSQSA